MRWTRARSSRGLVLCVALGALRCASPSVGEEGGLDAFSERSSDAASSADAPALDGTALDGPALDGPALDGPALDVLGGPDARPADAAGTEASADASPDAGARCTASAACPSGGACTQSACVSGACVTSPLTCAVAPEQTLAAACPSGTATYSVSLGGRCGGSCSASGGCAYAPQRGTCVSAAVAPGMGTAAPGLTLFFADEAYVWSYLQSLTAADFTLRSPGTGLPTALPAADDAVFQLYAALGGADPNSDVGIDLAPAGLRIAPAEFTTASMTRTPGALYGYYPYFDTLAAWATSTLPGNPYRDDPAVLRRAFATAFVSLVYEEGGSFGGATSSVNEYAMLTRGFWLLRGVAVAEALAQGAGGAAVPTCVQSAFNQLLARYFDRLVAGPIQVSESNTDMLTPALAALFRTAAHLGDEARMARAAARASQLLAPSTGLWHAAGYLHHGYNSQAHDPSYQGVADFFLTHAAVESRARPDFDVLRTRLSEALTLRAYLSLPDPANGGNGYAVLGPTHFAPATADPAPQDQWQYSARMLSQLLLGDDALASVLPPARSVVPDSAALRSAVTSRLNALNMALSSGSASLSPMSAADHFDTRPNYAARYDFAGLYAHVRGALGTPAAQLPVQRDTSALRALGTDWVYARRAAYGALVSVGNVSAGHPTSALYPTSCNTYGAAGCANAVNIGAEGFGGGALSAFWSPTAGPVLLGLSHGLQNGAEGRNAWGEGLGVNRQGSATDPLLSTVDAWWKWPTHALAGRTAAGHPFSSARVLSPTLSASPDGATLTLTGRISCATGAAGCSSDPTAALPGALAYTRVFELRPDVVHVTSTLTYDRAGTPLDQLVEQLPVYVGAWSEASATAPPVLLDAPAVQFQVGASLVAASTSYVANVSAVVLRRGAGTVRVEFDAPQRVRLTANLAAPSRSELWLNTYQWRVAAANLLVDLAGGATTVPARASVGYSLRAL